MQLNKNINYIVSGLERSGTSMLMQILRAADIDISYDISRPPDENNPEGYFELEGGKIINKLMDGSFSFDRHKGKVIKITAYGLKFLPPGDYKIIYSERNIEEILDSMEKMVGKKEKNREETKKIFIKLNNAIKKLISERTDADVLFVNYNKIISTPRDNIKTICSFLGLSDRYLEKMMSVINEKLYRHRKTIN